MLQIHLQSQESYLSALFFQYQSFFLRHLKNLVLCDSSNTARIIILMIWTLRSYFSSEFFSWVTDLMGSSYDSKKSFAFSNGSLWYTLVSWLAIFSDLPISKNAVLTNLPRGFDLEFRSNSTQTLHKPPWSSLL